MTIKLPTDNITDLTGGLSSSKAKEALPPTPPSDTDPNIVSYWYMDDNAIKPPTVNDANILAYYDYSEGSGTTLFDQSANGNDGTITGATWVGSSPYSSGDSLSFDGSGDYVTMPSGLTNGLVTATYEFRLKVDGTTGTRYMYLRTGGSGSDQIYVQATTNRVVADFDSCTGRQSWVSTTGLTAGVWYNVVIVVNLANAIQANRVRVYINGAVDGAVNSNTGSGSLSGTTEYISDTSSSFVGDIAYTGIYDRALSTDELLRHNNMGLSTRIADYVGTNHGVITGATFSTPGAFGYTGDYELSFDGTGDYVIAADAASQDISTGTLYVWYEGASPGSSYRGVVVKQFSYNIFLLDGVFGTFDWGGTATFKSSGVNVADGNRHMLAVTFQSGVTNGTKLYVDGVLQATTTWTVSNQNEGIAIGAGTDTGSTQLITGKVDNVILFNDIRTEAEVLTDYNNSI